MVIVGIDPGLGGAVAFLDAAAARFWPLVKHDGRAEAALIALYAAQALGSSGMNGRAAA
ncbi:MAG TPA: hypothetical protein VFC56_05035 [Stellaceae bacterium]|nr:hypothetical protein [Stellaceae bacterium]